MDILKNPILIGVFVGVCSYMYLKHQVDQENKNLDSKMPKKEVNLFIPLVVTVLAWFIAHNYFNASFVSAPSGPQVETVVVNEPAAVVVEREMISSGVGSGESVKSYHLISRGMSIPNEIPLPDVFIETG